MIKINIIINVDILDSALNSVHCTLYTVQCVLYIVHCTIYSVQCQYRLYNIQYTLYLCTVYNSWYIMNWIYIHYTLQFDICHLLLMIFQINMNHMLSIILIECIA